MDPRKYAPFLLFLTLALPPLATLASDDDSDSDVLDPGSLYRVALKYLKGNGVEQDSAIAIRWLEQAADQNFALAHFKLGELYRSGIGVEVDSQRAAEYIGMAAELGFSSAQYRLALMYNSGDGVEKDVDTAVEWLELAADHGHKKAGIMLANLVFDEKSYLVDMPSDTEINDQDAEFLFQTGKNHHQGIGMPRNYKEAAKWFIKAAGLGHPEAQFYLAELYKKGRGVKKNTEEAMRLYQAAAEQGHIKAKYRMKGCAFC